MTLGGRNRNRAGVTGDKEMGWKVFGPNAELLGGHTRTVIGGISKNTEDTGGEETCDRHCHPGEPLHEKVDRVQTIKFKRRTSSFSCISPWVIVIQPIPKAVQRRSCEKKEVETYILIRTIPSDHTSAARGEYVGATLFLHSIPENRGATAVSERHDRGARKHVP